MPQELAGIARAGSSPDAPTSRWLGPAGLFMDIRPWVGGDDAPETDRRNLHMPHELEPITSQERLDQAIKVYIEPVQNGSPYENDRIVTCELTQYDTANLILFNASRIPVVLKPRFPKDLLITKKKRQSKPPVVVGTAALRTF